jgi:hypothetical protein
LAIGWLSDHEWRPLAGALAAAVAAMLGLGHTKATPLGTGYAGLDLAGAAVLAGSAGFALSLRSRMAMSVAIQVQWRPRVWWLAATTLTLLLVVALAAGLRGDAATRLVNLSATVAFVPACVALLAGEGFALGYVGACATATVLTPTTGSHVPWWSPLLSEGGGVPRLCTSIVVIVVTGSIYLRKGPSRGSCWITTSTRAGRPGRGWRGRER